MGACDCPFCGPYALKTSSTNNAPVSPCSLSLDASIIDGAFEDFLVRSSQHITSFGVFKITPLRLDFKGMSLTRLAGVLIPLCSVFTCLAFPFHPPSQHTYNKPLLIHHYTLHLIKTNTQRQTGLAGTVHLGVFFSFSSSFFSTRVSFFGLLEIPPFTLNSYTIPSLCNRFFFFFVLL